MRFLPLRLPWTQPPEKPRRVKGERVEHHLKRVERWEVRRAQKKMFWTRVLVISCALAGALKMNATRFDHTEILTMSEFGGLCVIVMKIFKMPTEKDEDA
jgi:hypothetical protein